MNKPNILMFAIDDYRDFLGCLAVNPDVKTPNIDRLASSGVTFNNAHCQAPMCASSRASLLSGILPSTSGCYGFQPMRSIPILRDAVTIPQHFRENGYKVVGTGKIHHGKPIVGHGPHESEWDEYWPSITDPLISFNGEIHESEQLIKANFKFGISDTPESECGDAQHAAWAETQLKNQFSEPFFLGVGFFRPHLPFICPRKYFELYDRQKLSSILVKDNDLDDIPEAGRRLSLYVLDDMIRDRNLQLDILHAYLACVSYMDAQVGVVLDALEQSDYKDNTAIVFWSDNGWHFGEKLTWKKFTLWKEATRVPLIISAPGFAKGKISTKPVGLIDIYPTLLELCDLPNPSQILEGRSMAPLLKNPDSEWSYSVVTTHGRDSHCITTERWKYIQYFDGTEELYDRGNDNYEWINLANRVAHDEVKQQLKQCIPTINAPNAPGTTLKGYFSSDYPDLEKWRNQKAKWKEKHGKPEEAIELYQQSIALEAQQPLFVYLRLGRLLIRSNKYQEAIDILEKASTIYIDEFKIYTLLGQAYKKNNHEPNSIYCFQKSLSINQNQPIWIKNKIKQYQKKKPPVNELNLAEILASDTDYFVSDHCKIRINKSSQDVLISFSAINLPPRKFSSSNAIQKTKFNVIFVRCDNDWYLEGIKGLGNDISQTINNLKKLVLSITKSQGKVVTYGGSMGGYGSLLYGCLLNADTVIGAGTELELFVKGGITENIKNLHSKQKIEIINQINILEIVENSSSKINLYYGENRHSDLLCGLKLLQSKNVKLHSFKHLGHSVPPYVHQKYTLNKFIDSHLDSKINLLGDDSSVGDMFEYPNIIRCLHKIFCDFESLDESELDKIYNDLKNCTKNNDFSENVKSHAYSGLSYICQTKYDLKAATFYSLQATNLSPENMYFWSNLAHLYFLDNQYSQAISASTKAVELDIKGWNLDSFDAYCIKIESLINLEQYNLVDNNLDILVQRHPLGKMKREKKSRIEQIKQKKQSTITTGN